VDAFGDVELSFALWEVQRKEAQALAHGEPQV